MQLITIKESHYSSELAILKSRLESEGIKCIIQGELTSQVLSHIPAMNAKLQVRKSDFEKVRKIMIETGEWQKEKVKIVCPKCGSENFKIKRSSKERWRIFIAVFMALITFVAFANYKHSSLLVCKKCKHEFHN